MNNFRHKEKISNPSPYPLGEIASPLKPTLAELKKEWVTLLKIQGCSKHTLLAYENDWQDCYNFFKIDAIEELNNLSKLEWCGWFKARLDRGVCHRSNARALSSIKNFVDWGKEYGIKSAISDMDPPKFRKGLPRPLNLQETEELLNNLKQGERWEDVRDLALFTLLYGTGIRIGEALALRPKDLNSDWLYVMGKGKKERRVPLLTVVKERIEIYWEICPFKDTNFLFVGSRGKKLQHAIASQRIIKLRRLLGLNECTSLHSLRHTFASHLFRNNLDLRFIQALLGHQSLRSTQIYTKVDESKLLEIYNLKGLKDL